MALRLDTPPVAHVRFDGRSIDVRLDALGLGADANESEVKRAVARFLEVSENRLRDYVLDRHENGNVTIRPQAVFG